MRGRKPVKIVKIAKSAVKKFPRPPSDSELLHGLLDNIPDAIYFKDLKSRFIRVSRYLVNKAGIGNEKKMIGKTDFHFFTREHAQQAFNDEMAVIRSGKPIVGIEEKETWPDRPDTWVSTTKLPFLNRRGETIGTFGLSRDITEIKRYRDELQKAKNELEERVKERTAELSEAKSKVERNLEQLKFLNVTAYEFAQILDIGDMFDAIGGAFKARFPFAQIGICRRTAEGFSCVYADGILDTPEARALCETALEPFVGSGLAKPLFTGNWRRKRHLRLAWPPPLEEDPCWIALPLRADNKMTLAVIQLFIPRNDATVFRRERTLLSTLAAHAATCLSNAIHYRELEAKARVDGELQAARNIQQRLTPHETPSIPHISLAGAYVPAYEIGGDYLDYFPCGDGNWAVMVADVCGKGVPAAMLMTILRSVARVESRSSFTAKKLMTAVNGSICRNIDERSFITALCLVIGNDGSSMTYARAGHVKLLKLDIARQEVVAIDSRGAALGIVPDTAEFNSNLEEVVIPLSPGHSFLAYTDGVSEADNGRKQLYGVPRLMSVFKNLGGESADRIVEGILTDVKSFTGNGPASDDITMFAMKVTE
ncbi:MAG: SpoIIE family protein phosphatase [Chitinispirillaceae bacterium]|nr:SpoIIE family protein phosphatase [Chitinispirillaceae bacterium]